MAISVSARDTPLGVRPAFFSSAERRNAAKLDIWSDTNSVRGIDTNDRKSCLHVRNIVTTLNGAAWKLLNRVLVAWYLDYGSGFAGIYASPVTHKRLTFPRVQMGQLMRAASLGAARAPEGFVTSSNTGSFEHIGETSQEPH